MSGFRHFSSVEDKVLAQSPLPSLSSAHCPLCFVPFCLPFDSSQNIISCPHSEEIPWRNFLQTSACALLGLISVPELKPTLVNWGKLANNSRLLHLSLFKMFFVFSSLFSLVFLSLTFRYFACSLFSPAFSID